MTLDELQHRLLTDLRSINLPVDDVEIFIRPFSKTYYGRYFPSYDNMDIPPKVYLYPYEENGEFMPYDKILETTVHEMCHHIQYVSGHVRVKGVMHDTQFWKLYNHYMIKAHILLTGGESFAKEII